MKLFNEDVGDCRPLSEEYLFAYNKDYSNLFALTRHTNFDVIPAFTPEHSPFGKALLVTRVHTTLVAKFTTNGKVIIFDKDLFNEQLVVNRLDPQTTQTCFINMLNFLKSIHVLTSYQKFDFAEFLSSDKENFGMSVSRKDRFFMDKVFGNTCKAKDVNVSRVVVIGKEKFFEQISFNFFKSFTIIAQRYKDAVRFDFEFKQFKAYAVTTPEDNSRMEMIFKQMANAHLEKMSIHLSQDYIFTPEFFEYYDQITAMIEI